MPLDDNEEAEIVQTTNSFKEMVDRVCPVDK
jgi:NADPH-dependent glutamate synthase beta subunit-like oxidoreductase